MASPLVQEAVRVVQQAIDLDTRHQYAESVQRYEEALAIFARARDDVAVNDPVAAVTIAQKMEEYAGRAKTLRDALVQNPFHSPQPQAGGMGLSMAAPIPLGGGPPAGAPPSGDLRGYHEMPAARIQPVPAPLEYPAYIQPAGVQPVQAVYVAPAAYSALPAGVPLPSAPAMNRMSKSKEQEFVGHKNKIKFVVTLPRYAERLRPGEVVNLDVIVDNPTGCVVSCVKINLMKTVTRVQMYSNSSAKTETTKVKGDEYLQGGRFPMKEEKYEGSLEFALPSDLQPTSSVDSQANTSVFVGYDLVVKAAVKWHEDVELVFPIVVSHRI